MPEPGANAAGQAQRAVEEQDGEALQKKPEIQRASPGAGFEAGEAVEGQLRQQRGAGHSLPDAAQRYMEPRFGANFGNVRLHTDPQAATLNRQLARRPLRTAATYILGPANTIRVPKAATICWRTN